MIRTPKDMQGTITIKEYLERVIEEKDKLYDQRFRTSEISYDQRFRASEVAVQAALLAQKEAVANAFLASEKAIVKAEDAQKEYNIRSNEFRGQLDDQAKTLMPRTETGVLFKAVEDKLYSSQFNYDARLESLRISLEKSVENTAKELAGLREIHGLLNGKSAGATALFGYLIGAAGILFAVIFHFIK